MQTFRLIRAFRDFEIGTQFTRNEDSEWVMIVNEDEDEDVSDSVMETLLDVDGYLEDVTPTEWTPVLHSQVFVVTGAGEVKQKEFTDSDWFRLQKNFLGYFATRQEAEDRVNEINEILNSER